ncbi:SpoIVB peptidase S55 domain-containing protein, partial [Sorangium cellulosum]|uniref:SpoIVB peptidase S55 domain-containing protein n=1 Tax=Sorangium cellulosum TaxID=56 RepID=UPI000B1CAB69
MPLRESPCFRPDSSFAARVVPRASRCARAIAGAARALVDLEGRLIPLSLLAGAACSIAVGLGTAQAISTPPDTMPVSEVKPGMKGYGLTVFSGTTPEKFDVEVISTLRNFRPNQDLILIKTQHPRLEIARTVAGMSGSPIYVNGKMIGAYAYGWLFGAEAIAGVTPIKSMLDELARPLPPGIA